jgi:hypothetical protein
MPSEPVFTGMHKPRYRKSSDLQRGARTPPRVIRLVARSTNAPFVIARSTNAPRVIARSAKRDAAISTKHRNARAPHTGECPRTRCHYRGTPRLSLRGARSATRQSLPNTKRAFLHGDSPVGRLSPPSPQGRVYVPRYLSAPCIHRLRNASLASRPTRRSLKLPFPVEHFMFNEKRGIPRWPAFSPRAAKVVTKLFDRCRP